LFIVVFLCTTALAQSTATATTPSTDTAGSDPTVKASFGAVLQSLGWNTVPNTPPTLLSATGTLTRYAPDGSVFAQTKVTIKCNGNHQFRMDASDAFGSSSAIVNDLGGQLILPDGKRARLSASTAASMRPPWFPFLADAINLNDTHTVITGSGVALASGVPQQIHARLNADTDAVSRLRSRASDLTLHLGNDGAPIQIDFVRVAADNHYATIKFSLLLSDYQQIGTTKVAFRQEEQLGGKTTQVLVLESVQIGASSGVSPSDFKVQVPVSGGAQ
jgi:hypothetical protein